MYSPPLPADPLNRRFLGRQILITQALCLVVALVFALFGSKFSYALVYSVCIGNCTSAFITLGRYGLWHVLTTRGHPSSPALLRGWIGWPSMLVVVTVAVAAGYTVGGLLADALTGLQTAMPWNEAWRASLGIFVISLIPALIGTGLIYSRGRVSALEAEAAHSARLVAQTQLKLLESQLEPHMLFNTLANLRALIGVDPARAQTMLDRMIDYLRATLNASRSSSHTLSAEFSRLEDYLALMQIRMGERLQVQLDLPSALADLPVPPLLLQPLVENAIKHGLEPIRRGGLLTVSACRDGSTLLLQVRDSGAGLDPGAAAPAPTAPGSGFGLTQVRERLRTLHGDRASLALMPSPDGGTLAEVRLPWPTPPHTADPAKP
jgi:signal transduction histidine kinase